jgi:hypothetical protein
VEWKIPGECMLLFQFEDLAMRVVLIGPRRIAHWSSAMQHRSMRNVDVLLRTTWGDCANPTFPCYFPIICRFPLRTSIISPDRTQPGSCRQNIL